MQNRHKIVSEPTQTKYLTENQIGAVVSAIEPDWRGAVLSGLCTGLRVHDVLRLTRDAVNLQHATIEFPPAKPRVRAVPIIPQLSPFLKAAGAEVRFSGSKNVLGILLIGVRKM